jgi:hypothetical protein
MIDFTFHWVCIFSENAKNTGGNKTTIIKKITGIKNPESNFRVFIF